MTNNKKILNLIEKRLEIGAAKYEGQVPLDGSRDNLIESIEEALDLSVYLAAVLLELRRRGK